jgi:NACHT domain
MLHQEAVDQQLILFVQYRRTLAHLLQQAALYGGAPFAPPQTANGIAEARAQIARIKAVLREGGVKVEDEPNDEAPNDEMQPDTIIPSHATRNQMNTGSRPAIIDNTVQQGNIITGGTFQGPVISGVSGSTIISSGRDHISINGDYTRRDIDKRQAGAFIEDSVVYGDVIGGDNVTGDKVAGDKMGRDKVLGDKVLGDKSETHYYYYQPVAPSREGQQQRNRCAMLEKVKIIWIKGLLEHSLAEVVRIDLGLVDKPDALDLPLNLQYQELNLQPRPLLPGTSVIDIFTQTGGTLLILGAPGSGKTTLLLELVRDLVVRAGQDDNHPIPVVFNLSSWAEKRQPLKDWLVEELNTKYDVPRKLAQRWVDDHAILPLLDGLDEVAKDNREACVDAVNMYRHTHGLVPLAVCSRITDYNALTTKLRLQQAVVIQPLTAPQIETYLSSVGTQLAGLRMALAEEGALRELAVSPMMLNIMTLVYRNIPVTARIVADTIEEQQKRLFNAYVERMFARRRSERRYTQQQAIRWLTWLAKQLHEHNQTEFYIEYMQLDWLKPGPQKWHYERTSSDITLGLLMLFGGLALSLATGVTSGSFLGALILSSSVMGGGFFLAEILCGRRGDKVLDWLRQRSSLPTQLRFPVTLLLRDLVISLPLLAIFDVYRVVLIGVLLVPFLSVDILPLHIKARLPDWFWSVNMLRVCWGIVGGLLVGGFGSIIAGLLGDILCGIVGGVFFGLIYSQVQILSRKFADTAEQIRIIETIRWSWSDALVGLWVGLKYGFGLGVILGLISFLGIFKTARSDMSTKVAVGVVVGLCTCLCFGVLFGWFAGLLNGLRGRGIEMRLWPNQGVWRSARCALIGAVLGGLGAGMISGVIVALIVWFDGGFMDGLLTGASYGGRITIIGALIMGIIYGGRTCVQHAALRLTLFREKCIPLNYVRFLDYCADRIFLRKVGGGYIFVHRLLMEYFAALDITQTEVAQRARDKKV